MIHYHGGPITPELCAMRAWKARHAFVSFAAPSQIAIASDVCQSFALDNGAFSLWKAGKPTAWEKYYEWVDSWRTHPGFDFAVIPDVIGGTEDENDELLLKWPFPKHHAAAVWHSNESVARLVRLASEYPRVAIGSSGEYDVTKPKVFLERMRDVLPAICDGNGRPKCALHGLRMLNPVVFTMLPLKSADSTNVAQNIGLDKRWHGTYAPASKETRATVIAERIEQDNSAPDIHKLCPDDCSDLC